MKTENEINKNIIETTMVIDEKFPELSKYINEMPVTIPNTNEPDIIGLPNKIYSLIVSPQYIKHLSI